MTENAATVISDIADEAENDVTTEGSNSDKLITTTITSTEKPVAQSTVTSFPIETMDGSELATLIQLLTTISSITTSSSYANNGQEDKRPSSSSSMNDDFLGTTMTSNTVSNSDLPTTTTIIPTTESSSSSSPFKSNISSVPVQAEINEPVDNNTISSSHVINQSSSTQQFVTEVTSTRPYINKLGNISNFFHC